MSAPTTNSSLERITEALSAGRIAEAKELIRGLSPEESRNVEEANIAQGRALMEARAAQRRTAQEAEALRIKFVDEAGETSLYRIGLHLHPMSRVFEEYASANGIPLDALQFCFHGLSLPVECPLTAGQLGMSEEDNMIRVKVLKDRLPKRKPVSTISFVDEVGTKLDLAAQPNLHMYRLFQTYSEMRGMGLVWVLLRYIYKGERLSTLEDDTIAQLGMTDGDIIYVSLQMPSRKQLEGAKKDVAQIFEVDLPHSFVNCRVVDQSGEGGLPSEEIGTVVSYSGHGDDTIWTAEYPNNITKQYTRSELIRCAQTYYEMNGFEHDALAHLEQQAERLQSEVSSLEQRGDADADASILLALRIEQEIDQLQKLVESWPTFDNVQRKFLGLRLALIEVRKALVPKGKAIKPVLRAGETVNAKWRQGDSSGALSWMRGKVESSQCFEDRGYGPRREYCVRFDNGDVRDGIAEDQLMSEKTAGLINEPKWIGVEHRFDTESTDPWASNMGWFVAKIDGIEEPFTHLTDALRAFDAQTVACKGVGTEEGDLNIPYDWHTLAREYKDCEEICQEDNATHVREQRLYLFALTQQCVEAGIDFDQLCRFFIGAEGNIDIFLRSVPVFREGYYAASEGLNGMMAYLEDQAPAIKEKYVFVYLADANDGSGQLQPVERASPLKFILMVWAQDRNVSVKSLRIEHNGRTIFMSSIGKKTPEALGLEDDDVIKISVMHQAPPATAPKEEPQRKPQQRQKSKGKGKKAKTKSKKKRPHNIELPVNDEERDKKQWLDAISRVFVEADPQFREIRQRLNALSLQRTAPKQRKSRPKEEATAEAVDNPPSDGLGGKAGKSQFIVQVGEVSNLYKTAKPSTARKQSSGQISREVDLHGCTVDEALAKLDDCLPDWVDAAMKGEYPWVIAVRIVCGGGSQTLAEAVEGWIRQSPNVSNAPKNLFS
ncbi:hypothetical protein ACHAXT_000193 [Thalassiosira profunda]